MSARRKAAAWADRIEAELRRIGAWQAEPPPGPAFDSEQAFFADTMTFYQWLQFVLLARLREIAATGGEFPRESEVGAYAVRELDGVAGAGPLIGLLSEFDDIVEHL